MNINAWNNKTQDLIYLRINILILPKQSKIPNNSTERSHNIPFLDQYPEHEPSNLSRQFLALHHQILSGLPAESQEHEDSYPRHQRGRHRHRQRRHHGQNAEREPEKHRHVQRGRRIRRRILEFVPGKNGFEEIPRERE
ncbi:cell cycle checkpoint control protein family [Striga asiatica]|uniref:Cell cycle checkpoint control protein family n=1 Tax=Striga asiatica TaxID=4170 RepID=A0A5A7QAX1_STRAF|nr:cell cycle checkpoint control protein family [Striga asiatica]